MTSANISVANTSDSRNPSLHSAAGMPCKVCGTPVRQVFSRGKEDGILTEARFMEAGYERSYFRCPICGLLFHTGFDNLTEGQLSAIHDTGQGDRLDLTINRGIREFIMVHRIMELYGLPPSARLLIFGCGPGISYNMLLQHRRNVFATDMDIGFTNVREGIPSELFKVELMPQMVRRFRGLRELGADSFDMITLTEVFEHFLDPVLEMKRLASLVRPGGVIVGTTGWVDRVAEPTKDWWYLKCLSHATFLSSESFRRICATTNCLGTLHPANPALIGQSGMSDSQCIFVMQRPDKPEGTHRG